MPYPKKETFYQVEFTEAQYGYLYATLKFKKPLNERQVDILRIEFTNAKKIKHEVY